MGSFVAIGAGLVALLVMAPSAAGEPITLRAAVETALDRHPSIQRAAADHTAFVARIGRARAGLLPRLSASGLVRDDYVDPVDVSDSTVNFGQETTYNVGLTGTQLLTDGGQADALVAGARAAEQQAAVAIDVTRLDIELGAVRAYLQALQANELLAVSTNAIALASAQLARADALFKATVRPELDVLSAKTQLAQAELQRLADQSQADNAVVVLENALGDPRAVEPLPVEVRELAQELHPIDQLTREAIAHRAELAGQRDAIAGAESRVRASRLRRAPVVELQGGIFGQGSRSSHAPGSSLIPGAGGFVSLSVNWDLYLGAADDYELADATAQVRSAQAELTRQAQAIASSVGQAAIAVRGGRDALAVVLEWRTQAERQLQVALNRYKTGVGNFVELNDARTGLVNANRQEVQARYALAQSRITLARELGLRAGALAGAN